MPKIVFSWDNPTRGTSAMIKAMNEKAPEWREAAMREPGIRSLQAFVDPYSPVGAVSETYWDSLDDAFRFMNSKTWKMIVSDMLEMGATNIKARLWKEDPTTPVALRKPD